MTKPIITFVDADSIAYAAGYVEHPAEMEMAVDAYIRDIRAATQCAKLVGFVENPDGKSNFRKWVAVTKPYKGNRSGKEKPPFMVDAKRYLKSKHGFHFVTYMESEDAAAIQATAYGLEHSIIAAIDKDVHQVGGRFYDYRKKEWNVFTESEANYLLYKQILTGDSVDNIPGVPRMGPVGAEKALDTVGIKDGTSTLAEECAREYKVRDLSYEYLLEQSRLIYILRKRGEVFTPVTREQWEEL